MTDPTSRLNAALEGRYHIERELGAGGVGSPASGVGDGGDDIFDVSLDDRRFLMARVFDGGDPTNAARLVLVQNFFEELRSRVGN